MALKSTFVGRPPSGKVMVKCRPCGTQRLLPRSSGDPAGTSTGWQLCPSCRRKREAPAPELGQFGQDIRWVWPDGREVLLRDWFRAAPTASREALATAS